MPLKQNSAMERENRPEKVNLTWKGGDILEYNDLGVKITLGECCENPMPGEGFPPLRLVLVSLGGCTGIDVLQILRKMRVEFENLELKISGKRRNEHPRVYSSVEILYRFSGKNLDYETIKKAVKLSLNKYCPVAVMVKGTGEIRYRIELNEV